jgi:[protein-PII] uridylyltransferase
MLYPLWDAGFQVGHAARTARDTIDRAGSDLDAATAILSARLIAGDPAPYEELVDRRERFVRKEGKRLARRIVDATAERPSRRISRTTPAGCATSTRSDGWA